jgi:hypothetical protein
MSQELSSGDFLIFQLESGYGLLRLLAVDGSDGKVWHVAGYADLFPDIDAAEAATNDAARLTVSNPHLALTNRAFESTQVARIGNIPISDADLRPLNEWRNDPNGEISDRSVRLMLGLR